MAKLPIDVFDPGHGGADPGAVAQGLSLREKDLTLLIAKRMKQTAEANYETDIRMTRDTDKTMDLKARTDFANKLGAAIFVSIHINAGGGTGYEDFIHLNIKAGAKTASFREKYHAEIKKFLDKEKIRDRGMKQANFHVLRETKMTAILHENLFIDRKEDQAKLKDANFLMRLADAHAHAFCVAAGRKAKPKPKTQPAAPKITGQPGLHRVIVNGNQIAAYQSMSYLLRAVEKAIENGANQVRVERVK